MARRLDRLVHIWQPSEWRSSMSVPTEVSRHADSPVPAAAIDRLRGSVVGEVLTAADPGYDERRAVWNAMIDRRPALIVRCQGAADVMAAVTFAREHDLPISIRGG